MQTEESDSPEPHVPEGISLIAFGDVHGCLDKLESLLKRIAERVAEFPERRHIMVSVGDLVDRGPDSAQVVERLIQGIPGCETVVLRGNHEAMMLEFIRGGEDGENWLYNGGVHTLRSYGIDLVKSLAEDATLDSLRRKFCEVLPQKHLAFLLASPLLYECGGYAFVHAGVRPGRPLEKQDDEDLLWIRDEFLQWEGDFGKKIVHGHTPVEVATFNTNRINLDTGACFGGPLTAVLFEGREAAVFR
jgi:serine/threonine protein phosphatase 1